MFRKKIVYRLFIIFLVFACTFIIPLFIRININMDSVLSKYERVPADVRPNISQLRTDLNYKMFDDIAVMSFYSFFIAFLLSLFFSRKIVLPIRRLSQGAEAVRKGNFDVELPVMFNDELGEVTETFNRMARAIKEDTGELKKKDLYIRAMMDAMCILDAGDMIIDINPAFSKLFGYEKDDIADMSAYDLLDDENALIMRHEVDTSRVKGVSSSNQISIMSKTGENIPALITLSPITGEHQFDGTVMVIKDFREQANLINRLLESKKHLETIMNSIEDKMLLIDREYRIINANRSAFEVYGDDIIGRKCYSVGHDESKPCWTDGGDCPSKQVLENGNIARTIHEHKDRRGVSHYDEIVACPVRDMDGETIYVVELMRDVTESRKYEETISRKNRELATLNEISAMLSSSLKVDTIFAEVVAKLKDILDMDGGGVYLLDEDRKALNCVYHEGVSEDFAQMRGRIRIGEDIPGRVAVTGEGIMVQDVSRDYRIDRSILRFSGIKGYSCSPIRGKEKILGVICLFSFREHFFTEEEQRILMSAGKMAGLAADNINLYEKVKWLFEEQRKRRIREQRVLLEFAAAVSTFTDKRELLVFAVDLVMDYFNSTAAWFALVSDSGEITLDVIKGVEMEDEEKALPKGVYSIENAVAVSGDYLINSDILKEKQYYIPEVITRNSFRTVVSVPVKVSGRVYGVISLLYRRIAFIEEEDLHFLLVVSSILSVSIETADLYEKRIMDRGLAEAVFDSMSEGVCTVNTDGIVTSVNRALVNILNMPAASVVDRHFTDVLPH
ncbi:MAG TPA: PAS domain S-box protein, partial [Nitrospirae bacterium]|nr:PAS domain S-box protein [Nitrospirota bacterium]